MKTTSKGFVLVLASVFLLSVLCIPRDVEATPSGIFDVYAPTALSTLPLGYSSGPNNAMRLDGSSIHLVSASYGNSGVSTQNFTSSSYSTFWPPYSNRSAFPPSNATILSVSMIAIVYMQLHTEIEMFALEYVAGSYVSFASSPTWTTSLGTYKEFEVDLTDEYAWTASVLTNTSLIRVLILAIGTGNAVYVDYVGLSYTWQYGPPPPPEEDQTIFGISWTTNIFIATIGGVGFIGLIAYPALAIYSFRSKDDKLHAFVSFIFGETLFIAMLWIALLYFTGSL